MIINNLGTGITYKVTGSGSTQTVSGNLDPNAFTVLKPPGQAPFDVLLDGTLDVKGIPHANSAVTRFFCKGWQGEVAKEES